MKLVTICEIPYREAFEIWCEGKCSVIHDEQLYSYLHELAPTDGEGVVVYWKSYDPERSK